MVKPLVSVVIPAFNSLDYIEETLESVLAQTLDDFEVIVVDDASTDGSLELLKRLAAADSRVKILTSEDNTGQAACRNNATREASGTYIAFMDADDIWHPAKLERQLAFMQDRNLPFSFCGYGTIDEDGNVLRADLGIPYETDYYALLKSNTICTSSVVYNRDLLGAINMPERPTRREDWISWLVVSRKLGGTVYGLDQPLCMIRRVKGSSSSNKLQVLPGHWAVYRDVAGLGIFGSIYYLAHFMFASLGKRFSVHRLLKWRIR